MTDKSGILQWELFWRIPDSDQNCFKKKLKKIMGMSNWSQLWYPPLSQRPNSKISRERQKKNVYSIIPLYTPIMYPSPLPKDLDPCLLCLLYKTQLHGLPWTKKNMTKWGRWSSHQHSNGVGLRRKSSPETKVVPIIFLDKTIQSAFEWESKNHGYWQNRVENGCPGPKYTQK